jgi:putative membrane-bound dehydrogenase-like protein
MRMSDPACGPRGIRAAAMTADGPDTSLGGGRPTRPAALAVVILACVAAAVARGESWNQFRGPGGDGRAASGRLPTEWSEEKNVRWKTEIPGKAWASPVELDGRIWLANATPDGTRLSAVCVDAGTGRVLHDVTVFEVEKPAFCHDYNSYASPTPVIEPGRLYVHFGSAGTAALDPATGAILWKRQDIPCDHHRGPGSSPILFENLLILCFDGFDVQYVTALDKETGKTVWRTDRTIDYGTDDGDMKKSYGTPTVVDHGGRLQLVCPAAVGTVAYDPRTGKELWKVQHGGYNTAARPLFTHGLVVICTQSGDRMLAVKPDGSGDVTKTHVAWKFGKSTPTRPSQTVVGDHLYMVSDTGIFGAIDVRTGQQAWSERRTGRHSASLVESGGRLYAFDEDGGAVVFAATPEGFRLVAENKLAAGCMASPAVVGDDLVVRTKTHLYRLGGPPAGAKTDAPPRSAMNTEPGDPMAAADAARAVRPGRSAPEGVEVTLFAAEPVITNPIGAATDPQGRLWVAENLTYAEKSVLRDGPLRDRVSVLEDADGDGVAERQRVAIDGLEGLTGVAVGHGGVWLACPPRLLFVPGLDRSEATRPASAARVVLDGFDVPPRNHHNFMNGLSFGPDGWLYGRCGASAPGDVGPPGAGPEARRPLRGGVWRYHPARGTFEALCHGTTNPWGHDWNSRGDCFFVNTVNGHLWQVIPGGHYVRPHTVDPNPHVYEPIDQHADHFHFDTARKWTESRDGKADAHGGGHAHSGCFIVPDEPGWPASLRGRLLTLNFHGRRINAERFTVEGSATIAGHDPDALFFDDPWFRGIDIVPLPGRRLAVLDWSDAGECHEHSGVHRTSGRILAVRFRAPAAEEASREPVDDLIRGAAWRSRAALRGLADRHAHGDDLAAERAALAAALRAPADAPTTTTRLRALWGLACTGGLAESDLIDLCGDPDAAVRAWGVRLLSDHWPLDTVMSERGGADVEPSAAALAAIERLARVDVDARVRLAVASTLQRLPFARRAAAAAALAARVAKAARPLGGPRPRPGPRAVSATLGTHGR